MNVNCLDQYNCDWVSLLKEMEGYERTKEEEHQRVTEGIEGFIEVLLDAITRLEAKMNWRAKEDRPEWSRISGMEFILYKLVRSPLALGLISPSSSYPHLMVPCVIGMSFGMHSSHPCRNNEL